jgi:hypothetical protein
MRKVLLACFVFIWSVFIYSDRASAGPSIDQQHTAGTGSLAISTGLRMAQRFMPTMTGLCKVELELTNVGSNQKISIAIRHTSDGTNWDEGALATVSNQTVTNGWNVFDFEDITVDTSPAYAIFITAADYGPQWKYKGGPSEYGNGYAIFQNNPQYDWDFNFKTWGTNPVDTVDENTQPTGQQSDSDNGDSSAVAGKTPTATTSSSIEKPTELKAEYAEGAKLTWKASKTTDISGYLVFRSEAKGEGYQGIGKVEKTKVEYLDKTAVAGTTYYYIVRAYKGTDQSASSNEASLTIPASAGPISPLNLKVLFSGTNFIKIGWDKNPESNISSYNLILNKGDEEVKTASVDADITSYNFKELTADTLYTIKLSAKNSDGKESEKSEISQRTSAEISSTDNRIFEMDTLSWSLLGLTSVLLGVLVLLIIRRKRLQKI